MNKENVESMAELSNLLQVDNGEGLRGMLMMALRTFMEAEVSRLCGAEHGERSSERVNQRNGYRDRTLETRMGTVELKVPKVRQGTYFPSFLEPRRRWEKAFVNVVSEAYVKGVSTRSVEQLVEAMGAKGMSKSSVSRMAAVLDEEVEAFRNRPLGEQAFPYVWFDALYVKVRENGRVVSRAVLVAIGVNEQGEREVLGVSVAEKELESSWRAFMRSLVERGLRGVELAISDAHEGLRQAIRAVFNGASWQRCYVHFIRNVLSHVPKSAQGFVAALLRNVFQQTSHAAAQAALRQAVDTLEDKYANVARLVEEAESDVLAYFHFPEPHWRQIRSTNPLERLNKELRRRVRVVGIFPTRASVLRLVGMLLVEQDDEWKVSSRRYFSVGSMARLQQLTEGKRLLEDQDAA